MSQLSAEVLPPMTEPHPGLLWFNQSGPVGEPPSPVMEKGVLKGKDLDEVLDLLAMTELGVPGQRK